MKSKFDVIFEDYANKFSRGGFLPGDFVKFKSDVLSNPAVQAGSEDYINKIKELMESDLHLRIHTLSAAGATNHPASVGTADRYYATVYQTLPGNSATSTDNVITVPLSVLERVAPASAESQMPIPGSTFHENCEKIKDAFSKIDFLDDSYDKGKSVTNKKTPESDDEEFEVETDEFPSAKVLKKEAKDVKMMDNFKFFIVDNHTGEVVVQRNVHPQEKLNVENMFKKWAKENGYKVVGKATVDGDFYARISDSLDSVRVWDSGEFFVDVEDY